MHFLIEIMFWVRRSREEGLPAFGMTKDGALTPGPACGCAGKEELVQDNPHPPPPQPYSGFFKAV